MVEIAGSKDPNSTEVLRDYVREAMRYFQLASFCDMALWKFCFLQVARDFLNSGVSLRGCYIYSLCLLSCSLDTGSTFMTTRWSRMRKNWIGVEKNIWVFFFVSLGASLVGPSNQNIWHVSFALPKVRGAMFNLRFYSKFHALLSPQAIPQDVVNAWPPVRSSIIRPGRQR